MLFVIPGSDAPRHGCPTWVLSEDLVAAIVTEDEAGISWGCPIWNRICRYKQQGFVVPGAGEQEIKSPCVD